MGFEGIEREIELTTSFESRIVQFKIDNNESIELTVPPTVYPPRQDTQLLLRGLELLTGKPHHLVEIGTGSGAVAIVMAKRGTKVTAYDVNPLSVAAARGNATECEVSHLVTVEEGGVGEDSWAIPKDSDVVVWNLPYLEPAIEEGPILGPLEEAALGDEPGSNWSKSLLDSLSEEDDGRTFVLLFRVDPLSPSEPNDWTKAGWARRCLAKERVGDDTLEVVAFWKPDGDKPAEYIEVCDSTMDAARNLSGDGWLRIRSDHQSGGRGRQGSTWTSSPGDLTATWSLKPSIIQNYPPGLLQTVVGAKVSEALEMDMKWPNDLLYQGRKAGGILVESSSVDGRVRIGIGLNRHPRIIDGQETAGWSETIGEVDESALFPRIDSAIASLFDTPQYLPQVPPKQMCRESWKALAKSLSRGVVSENEEGRVQIIGLKETGSLLVSDGQKLAETDDVGGLVIAF